MGDTMHLRIRNQARIRRLVLLRYWRLALLWRGRHRARVLLLVRLRHRLRARLHHSPSGRT